MTSQTQSNIQVIQLLLLLFGPVFDVAPSREENNTRLGNTFFITSMYLGTDHNAQEGPKRIYLLVDVMKETLPLHEHDHLE
jgi:hypothetical protein